MARARRLSAICCLLVGGVLADPVRSLTIPSRRYISVHPSTTTTTTTTTTRSKSACASIFPTSSKTCAKTINSIQRGGALPSVNPTLLEQHPFASAVVITTCNAAAADLLTQFVFESDKKWEPARTLIFACFGFLFQGCSQYAIVNLGWERLIPGTSRKSVLAKMAAMNFISDPLLFFPCFYIFKESLQRKQIAIKGALSRYSENCVQDWFNSWSVWFPGHAVTYGVMAPHNRIPWMAFLSFFYMCILSLTRGGGERGIQSKEIYN